MSMLPSHDQLLGYYLRLFGFRSRRLRVKSCEMHYFEKRHPQEKGVLVFVHGVGASSGHFARLLNPLWKKGYTILAPDLPSHGQSSDSEEYLDSNHFYELFYEWANAVIPKKFVLIGNSLGGALSLCYACENPERLKHLVLISPAGGFESQDEWDKFKSILKFQSIEDSKRFIPWIYHRAPLYLPLTYRPFLRSMQRKGLRELIEGTEFQSFCLAPHVLKQLPSTLFIWGKSEKFFPRKHLDQFRKLLPSHVVYEEPEGVGHCPQLDNPKWVTDRIATLLCEKEVRGSLRAAVY